MNILFDGNYLIHKTYSVWQTYYTGQDMSVVLSNPENQQVLIRKIIIDMCATLQRFKDIKRVAFVIDSHSWRYSIHPDYKYALTRVRDAHYKLFLMIIDMFEALLRKRGFIVSRVPGAEGDDLLYVWSLYFGYILDEELVIITGDSDIRQIITPNISLFNNHSKNLKLYCLKENESRWNRHFDDDMPIQIIDPFEVLLYKVLMGDSSDNVTKVKKGFGDKAFEKFINYVKPYPAFVTDNPDLMKLAQYIAGKFCEFAKMDEREVLGQVIQNLKLTWLNMSVYNNTDYPTPTGKGLLENMLDDLNNQRDKYTYKKEFTLESFYNMLLK